MAQQELELSKAEREATIQQLALMTGTSPKYYNNLSDDELNKQLADEMGRRYGQA